MTRPSQLEFIQAGFDAGIFIFIIDFFDFDAGVSGRGTGEIGVDVIDVIGPSIRRSYRSRPNCTARRSVGDDKHEAPWFFGPWPRALITPFKPPAVAAGVMMRSFHKK